jgi:hypothetical protein
MEVSGQLHALAVLQEGKNVLTHWDWRGGGTSQSFWMCRRSANSLPLSGIEPWSSNPLLVTELADWAVPIREGRHSHVGLYKAISPSVDKVNVVWNFTSMPTFIFMWHLDPVISVFLWPCGCRISISFLSSAEFQISHSFAFTRPYILIIWHWTRKRLTFWILQIAIPAHTKIVLGN